MIPEKYAMLQQTMVIVLWSASAVCTVFTPQNSIFLMLQHALKSESAETYFLVIKMLPFLHFVSHQHSIPSYTYFLKSMVIIIIIIIDFL